MNNDSPTDRTIVHLKDVTRIYPHPTRPVQALRGVDMDIDAGQFVAIMGPSGSGKSTLLHVIGGLDRPDSGEVLVGGRDLRRLNDRQLTLFRRRRVGVVFQAFNLVGTLTAQENVALPMVIDRAPKAKVASRSAELLEMVGLASRADHRPDALSGGEQQRVAIARALLMNPDIILADEPTGNLDSASAEAIWQLLRELCRNLGKTICAVTHEAGAASRTDWTVFIKDGRIIGSIDPAQARHDPSLVAARYQELAG